MSKPLDYGKINRRDMRLSVKTDPHDYTTKYKPDPSKRLKKGQFYVGSASHNIGKSRAAALALPKIKIGDE